MGRVKRKRAFKYAQNAKNQIILRMRKVSSRPFTLHSYILWYPMILLADSDGPDQTAWMRRLIWAFAVRMCPKDTFLHGAAVLFGSPRKDEMVTIFLRKQNNALFDVQRGKRELIVYSANEKPDQLRIRAVQCLPFPPTK